MVQNKVIKMTRVEFFFNVPDKFSKIVELCDKAVGKGHQLTIFTQDELISNRLKQQLWQYSATSYLPSSQSTDSMSQFSPIVFNASGESLHQDDILINLQVEYPPFFSRFKYLVELVGEDETDKLAARLRYRFYRDRGYEVKSTDVSAAKAV
jgi:DNA polymerase-3 subunit chi